ncbi:twin-arginine translocase subunit TatC [Candidatus Aquiluna sp. IMCC13023]|uniref:twin-arginine translocase subunit TatC n=1 Tax=Candidatus Aquiluna sp. IMCC13023 TaxID=1081644 RepID=UPI00201D9B10|nr:twin-arginine translocase subunit TatC [Candidatus Aquiluna sp. IMCC13023]
MSLSSHLREFRVRLSWSAGFVIAGTVVGWFLFDPVFKVLQGPLLDVTRERGIDAIVNFGTVVSAFDLRIQISIFLGVLMTAPVWLWNLWAFVSPGLKIRERRYAVGFVFSALPLFLLGTYLAWTSLPGFVVVLIGFTPEGSSNVINAAEYVLFAIRILLIFGLAFVMPVVLVLMNFAGLVTGRGILKSWRIALLIIATVSALATPTAEPMSMFLLMAPLTALFFTAVGIAVTNDKRRARKLAKFVDDDIEVE